MSPGVMEQLDVDIVPYIVLLVVPVLGRMSDPSDSIRFMATQCFATLIRLLPLEVGAHKQKAKMTKSLTHCYTINTMLLSSVLLLKLLFPVVLSTRQVYQTLQPCPLT